MAENVHLCTILVESEVVLDIKHNLLLVNSELDEELLLPAQDCGKACQCLNIVSDSYMTLMSLPDAQQPRGTDHFQAKKHYLLSP